MREKKVSLRDAVLFFITCEELASGYPGISDLSFIALQMGGGDFQVTFEEGANYDLDRDRLDDVSFAPQAPMKITTGGKYTGLRRMSSYDFQGNIESAGFSAAEIITGRKLDVGASTIATEWPRMLGIPESWLFMNDAADARVGCVPYCTWIELHLNPNLSCNQGIEGEAQLYRYFRPDGGVSPQISNGEMSISGTCHIMQPQVWRGDLGYTTLETAAPLLLGLNGVTNPWVKDYRSNANVTI